MKTQHEKERITFLSTSEFKQKLKQKASEHDMDMSQYIKHCLNVLWENNEKGDK